MSSSSWHRLLLEPRGVTNTIALFSSGDGLLTRPALPTEGLEGETRGWSCLRKSPRPRQGRAIGRDKGLSSGPTKACHRTRQGRAIGPDKGLPSDASRACHRTLATNGGVPLLSPSAPGRVPLRSPNALGRVPTSVPVGSWPRYPAVSERTWPRSPDVPERTWPRPLTVPKRSWPRSRDVPERTWPRSSVGPKRTSPRSSAVPKLTWPRSLTAPPASTKPWPWSTLASHGELKKKDTKRDAVQSHQCIGCARETQRIRAFTVGHRFIFC